jgi:uncharacterized protein YciI
VHAAVLYSRGRAWDEQRPLGEQESLREHLAFLVGLAREGHVRRAGPFHPFEARVEARLVGLVLLEAETLDHARELIGRDPAVAAGLMEVEVLPWFPQDARA